MGGWSNSDLLECRAPHRACRGGCPLLSPIRCLRRKVTFTRVLLGSRFCHSVPKNNSRFRAFSSRLSGYIEATDEVNFIWWLENHPKDRYQWKELVQGCWWRWPILSQEETNRNITPNHSGRAIDVSINGVEVIRADREINLWNRNILEMFAQIYSI